MNADHAPSSVRLFVCGGGGYLIAGMLLLAVPAISQSKVPYTHAIVSSTAAQVNTVQQSQSVENSDGNLQPKVSSPTSEVSSDKTWVVNWDAMAVWSTILLIVLLGAFAAIYPISFYVGQVWKSRQQTIFETLDVPAKKSYLELYHPSEATDLKDDKATSSTFNAVYDHWFGRDRLLRPAWFASVFIVVYLFLSAIRAAKALFPRSPAATAIPLNIDLIAVASMAGAYVLVSMDTISRVTRRDLLPEDLYLTTLRLAACVPLGYAFASLVAGSPQAPFIALALTAFPLQQLAVFLQQIGAKQLGVSMQAQPVSADVPSQLAGVEVTVCDRFAAIGVNSISQIAYGDPVLLTVRTSLNFLYILDVVNQSLAWIYLEMKLAKLRPIALRGAVEMKEFYGRYVAGDASAVIIMGELATLLEMSLEQTKNMFSKIASDPRVSFLAQAFR